MSQPLDRPYRNLDSAELEKVRRELEEKSRGIREGAVQPTQMGLTDPSQPLKNYCPKCGFGASEPFGPHGLSSKMVNVHGNSVEAYPGGGVIIYTEHDMAMWMEKTSGLGSSGQLGFTRFVLWPKK